MDRSLAAFPADDHRLFVGDLGGEATDGLLAAAFSKYPSFLMARAVADGRTGRCKGYGFVSFGAAADAVAALREMNGKYVGSRPVKLKRSDWSKRNLDAGNNREVVEVLRAATAVVGLVALWARRYCRVGATVG